MFFISLVFGSLNFSMFPTGLALNHLKFLLMVFSSSVNSFASSSFISVVMYFLGDTLAVYPWLLIAFSHVVCDNEPSISCISF